MTYQTLAQEVKLELNTSAARAAASERKFHSFSKKVCKTPEVLLYYPGYKTTANKVDYRVDVKIGDNYVALSHVDIIIDIYNKISQGVEAGLMRDIIMDLGINNNIDATIVTTFPDNLVAPSKALLNSVRSTLESLGKRFNSTANLVDIPIETLLESIRWIALQEDINYPISSGYQGRKMCFSRYLETIYVSSRGQTDEHNLQKVISRALSHSRIRNWPNLSIYTGIDLMQ